MIKSLIQHHHFTKSIITLFLLYNLCIMYTVYFGGNLDESQDAYLPCPDLPISIYYQHPLSSSSILWNAITKALSSVKFPTSWNVWEQKGVTLWLVCISQVPQLWDGEPEQFTFNQVFLGKGWCFFRFSLVFVYNFVFVFVSMYVFVFAVLYVSDSSTCSQWHLLASRSRFAYFLSAPVETLS